MAKTARKKTPTTPASTETAAAPKKRGRPKKNPTPEADIDIAAATNETPAEKPKRGRPKKGLPGSPAAEQDKKLTRKALGELGDEIINRKGRAPFAIPKDPKDITTRATDLNTARDSGEVELSALLYVIRGGPGREAPLYTAEGFDTFEEYCEKKLDISSSKGRTLATNWEMFTETLGLPPHVLRVVSFNKFKLLVAAVKAGHINNSNVREWLPLLQNDGPTALSRPELEKQVKDFMAKREGSGKEDDKDPMRAFRINFRQSEIDGFIETLANYKENVGLESDSEAVQQALDFAASNAISDSGKVAMGTGIVGLVNMIARMANVTPILVSNDEENFNFETMGLHPASRIFCVIDTRGESGEWGRMCIAGSKEAAAAHLGVKVTAIREFQFSVAEDIRPTAQYLAASVSEIVEPEETQLSFSDDEEDSEAESLAEAGDDVDVAREDVSFSFTDENIGDFIRCAYKDEGEIDAEIISVNVEDEVLKIKQVDENWEATGRAKAIAFSDVREIYEFDDEEDEVEASAEESESGEEEAEDESLDLSISADEIPVFETSAETLKDINRVCSMIKKKSGPALNEIIEKKNEISEAVRKKHAGKSSVEEAQLDGARQLQSFAYATASKLGLDPYAVTNA